MKVFIQVDKYDYLRPVSLTAFLAFIGKEVKPV
jgi:hypothetical protein